MTTLPNSDGIVLNTIFSKMRRHRAFSHQENKGLCVSVFFACIKEFFTKNTL